jgi:hypothetical protein
MACTYATTLTRRFAAPPTTGEATFHCDAGRRDADQHETRWTMPHFLDTNALLHAISPHPEEAGKQAQADALPARDDGALSVQVPLNRHPAALSIA